MAEVMLLLAMMCMWISIPLALFAYGIDRVAMRVGLVLMCVGLVLVGVAVWVG